LLEGSMAADTTGGTDRPEATASETPTLVAVSAAHLVSHIYIMLLPVLLPLLKERLGVSFLEIGLALTAFNVVTGLTLAPMGFLVDRVGARPVLVTGLVCGGLVFLSLGLLTTYPWLIAVAVLAGLANCVYHPADYAILSNLSENRMGRAFAVHTFAGFAGGAIAPPLLLGLAAFGGIEAALVVTGLLGPITGLLLLFVPMQQPATKLPRAGRSDTGTAAAGISNIITPTVLGLTAFFVLIALAGSAINSFSVVALIATQGISFAAANAVLTAYLVGSAVGVLLGGAIADKVRRHGDMAAISCGLSALILLLVAVLDLSVAPLMLAMGASGLMFGIVQPARDLLVRRAAPPGAVGRVFSVVSTGFNIGGIIGPLIFGWVMDHGHPRWVFYGAVLFIAMTALYGFFEERRGFRRRALPSSVG
jgi:MFS transporter, FSR family, fosmidomycin resistance protein